MVALAGIAIGVVALVAVYRGRAADAALKGQHVAVTVPSRALTLRLPAFIAAYGQPIIVDAAHTVGFIAGDPNRGNYVAVAVSPSEAEPFAADGFPAWLAEAYLTCLATVDAEAGRDFWAVETNKDLRSHPYTLKYAVARNKIPLVSRVCLAGTNGVSDVNVRIVGGFTGNNFKRFAADMEAMFTSVVVDEAVARQRLGLQPE